MGIVWLLIRLQMIEHSLYHTLFPSFPTRLLLSNNRHDRINVIARLIATHIVWQDNHPYQ